MRYRRKYDARADKDRAEEVAILAGGGGEANAERQRALGADGATGVPPDEHDAEEPAGDVESVDACPTPPRADPVDLEQQYRKRWRCGLELTHGGRVSRRY